MFELPKPVFSSAALAGDSGHPQYPSAAFLDAKTVFVSDGHGGMYVLDVPKGRPAQLLGQYKLRQSTQPFRIHHAVAISPNHAVVLLSSRHVADPPADSTGRPKRPPPEYDVWAVRFSLPFEMIVDDVQMLDVIWQRRGDDVPMYTAFDHSRNTFLLIGSSLYREIGARPSPSFQPSPDEIAPIPRRDEALDDKHPTADKPPPYSWTQTSDSVTIAFPLPSGTPKTSIKVAFTPRALTLHLQGITTNDHGPLPLPHYSLKPFWDGIQPSTSFWTWDREAEHAYGLLTLHLDKQHEGTRWMHVFATTASPPDIEVPETLDPSELGRIREVLEKYTSSLRDGSDTSGLGLGKGVPSLADGEMDDEVDASVGRDVYLTPVGMTSGTDEAGLATVRVKASDAPFVLLSTPLPGSPSRHVSLVIKTGLDGALFRLDPLEAPRTGAEGQDDDKVVTDALHWTHTGSYSALAFVLASKQDTRFTHHVGAKTVLAFESASSGRGGNVYIYRGARTGDKWAKQSVLKASDAGGSLLGVGALQVSSGTQRILCLTERQLVVISDVM